MQIVIPSYRRAGLARTYESIPHRYLDDTLLAVRYSELRDYEKYYPQANFMLIPNIMRGIADTRDYIIDNLPDCDKILMIDDDLDFAVRRTDDPTRFREATGTDIGGMLDSLDYLLDSYTHVSVSPREGANRDTSGVRLVSRAMRVLGYRRSVLSGLKVRFGPATFMCDFHATLALLTQGYPNAVLNTYVHNQPGSNTKGGCSEQRTPETQKAAAEWLWAHYPDFVTVVQKQTKTSWKGESRYDVRIQWQRAYLAGKNRQAALLDEGTGDGAGAQGGGSP